MEEVSFGILENPLFTRKDDRGVFEELVNAGIWESLIHGKMKQNAVMGNHYHSHTVLFFYLLEGSTQIVTIQVDTRERKEFFLKSGQGFVFHPNEARSIKYLEDSRFLIMKSHRFDPDKPDLIDFQVS